MSKPLVSDELWALVASLLPPEPPKPKGGRPRVSDRAALTGIVFVLKSGIPWGDAAAGNGLRFRRDLLAPVARLAGGGRVGPAAPDLARSAGRSRPDRLEPSSAGLGQRSGQKGGEAVGPNPTDRGKPGTKRHVVGDRHGLPLASLVTGANRHDSVVFDDVLDAIPPIRTPAGRRRKRPAKLHADKAYDMPRCRQALRRRHIRCRIARKGIDSSERLGRRRWVIERTLSWLNCYRRLTVRYERRADIHQAFLTLGCALICFHALQKRFWF